MTSMSINSPPSSPSVSTWHSVSVIRVLRGRSFRDTLFGKVRYGASTIKDKVSGEEKEIPVVIKEYDCQLVETRMTKNGEKVGEDAKEELRLHSLLCSTRHPNIVHLFDVRKDEHFYYAILEFCARGEFFPLVQMEQFNDKYAKFYFKQMMEGIQHMHQVGVAHRDLSLENILLDEGGTLKICDFGVAIQCKEGEMVKDGDVPVGKCIAVDTLVGVSGGGVMRAGDIVDMAKKYHSIRTRNRHSDTSPSPFVIPSDSSLPLLLDENGNPQCILQLLTGRSPFGYSIHYSSLHSPYKVTMGHQLSLRYYGMSLSIIHFPLIKMWKAVGFHKGQQRFMVKTCQYKEENPQADGDFCPHCESSVIPLSPTPSPSLDSVSPSSPSPSCVSSYCFSRFPLSTLTFFSEFFSPKHKNYIPHPIYNPHHFNASYDQYDNPLEKKPTFHPLRHQHDPSMDEFPLCDSSSSSFSSLLLWCESMKKEDFATFDEGIHIEVERFDMLNSSQQALFSPIMPSNIIASSSPFVPSLALPSVSPFPIYTSFLSRLRSLVDDSSCPRVSIHLEDGEFDWVGMEVSGENKNFVIAVKSEHSIHSSLPSHSSSSPSLPLPLPLLPLLTSNCRFYMPPEIFSRQRYSPHLADVWTTGIILFVMLTKVHPFKYSTPTDQRFLIVYGGHINELLSRWGKPLLDREPLDLLQRILCPPEKRISVDMILKHPYLSDSYVPSQGNNNQNQNNSPNHSTSPSSTTSSSNPNHFNDASRPSHDPSAFTSPATPNISFAHSTSTSSSTFNTSSGNHHISDGKERDRDVRMNEGGDGNHSQSSSSSSSSSFHSSLQAAKMAIHGASPSPAPSFVNKFPMGNKTPGVSRSTSGSGDVHMKEY